MTTSTLLITGIEFDRVKLDTYQTDYDLDKTATRNYHYDLTRNGSSFLGNLLHEESTRKILKVLKDIQEHGSYQVLSRNSSRIMKRGTELTIDGRICAVYETEDECGEAQRTLKLLQSAL